MAGSIYGVHERSVDMAFRRRAFTDPIIIPEVPGEPTFPDGDSPFVNDSGGFLITNLGARITFLPLASSSSMIGWLTGGGNTAITSTGARLVFATG